MNDFLVIAINVSYLIVGNLIVDKLNLEFLGKRGTWTNSCATLFIASIFFTIGLLFFDIPLGILGGNDAYSVQRMKEFWWFYPSGLFVICVLSLNLRCIFAYVRGKSGRDRAKSKLFLYSFFVTGSCTTLVITLWFIDDKPAPLLGDYIIIVIAHLIGTVLLFAGSISLRKLLSHSI